MTPLRVKDVIDASMRPRHKAAENPVRGGDGLCGVARASMRPRHKAAENPLGVDARADHVADASMRPRHKAAENPAQAGYLNIEAVLLQ